MIVSLKGILDVREPDHVVIDVGGVGYLCFISVNVYDSLPAAGKIIKLLTYHHITEKGQELFGFAEEDERSLFKLLISVSGIGPKTAIQLLSAVVPAEFKRRIVAGEVGMLTSLPGIGPKTARRIIVELKDKFVKLSDEELPIEGDEVLQPEIEETITALTHLGFKPAEIRKVLKKITDKTTGLDTQELIRQALNLLR